MVKILLKKVSKELGLNIKVIDGTKEAYYGGIAALNLLPQKSFVTVDIGGGSTEFSFVNEKKIEETISLKIGTVRMHELYFKNDDLDGAKEYILNQLKLLPSSKQDSVVGLGGSARALSRMILAADNYPLNVLHGFEYKVEDNIEPF